MKKQWPGGHDNFSDYWEEEIGVFGTLFILGCMFWVAMFIVLLIDPNILK